MFKSALILTLFAATAVTAQAQDRTDYGNAVNGGGADKRIVITPQTRSVNVTDGETVEFLVDGKRFNWHFATYPNETNFALNRIAPREVRVDGVRVYIARNPIYRGY
ncbi:MAG: CzcE family metal-binding protein [Pseudomonadota bacterium]